MGKVREMIDLPLRHSEIFEKLGGEAPKDVLLFGIILESDLDPKHMIKT